VLEAVVLDVLRDQRPQARFGDEVIARAHEPEQAAERIEGCATRTSSASSRSSGIKGIEFVAHYSEIGGGYGGYNQDHEFFGYRQSI
jgi:hypothetical protein